ncbi:TPA: hypothetical protein ACHWJ6_000806 [Streptococcus suis]
MSDMMKTIAERFKLQPELKDLVIKPYYRPESLGKNEPSLIIVPMAPPKQKGYGSDKPLRKEFTYQITIEAKTKVRCTEIALACERVMLELGFTQLNGGLDEYFIETARYVDARRYRGYSKLYDTNY